MRESAVFIWNDRALFVGDRSETALHSHHAVELAVALDSRGIDMTSPDGVTFVAAAAVAVRSDRMHALTVPGPKVAVLYIDAWSPLGEGLHNWLGQRDIRAVPKELVDVHRAGLRNLLSEEAKLPEARVATDDLLAALVPSPRPARHDPRVGRAMKMLDERLDAPPTLGALAHAVGLSASRLGHLFRSQVGLPMRRYVLWMRLRAALTEAMTRGDMARAAHAAGFSDAAHFTRTCRRMFGLPPSAFAPVDAIFVSPPR